MDFIEFLQSGSADNRIFYNGSDFKTENDYQTHFVVDKYGKVKDSRGKNTGYELRAYKELSPEFLEWFIIRDGEPLFIVKGENGVVTLKDISEAERKDILDILKSHSRFIKFMALTFPVVAGLLVLFFFMFFEVFK